MSIKLVYLDGIIGINFIFKNYIVFALPCIDNYHSVQDAFHHSNTGSANTSVRLSYSVSAARQNTSLFCENRFEICIDIWLENRNKRNE